MYKQNFSALSKPPSIYIAPKIASNISPNIALFFLPFEESSHLPSLICLSIPCFFTTALKESSQTNLALFLVISPSFILGFELYSFLDTICSKIASPKNSSLSLYESIPGNFFSCA